MTSTLRALQTGVLCAVVLGLPQAVHAQAPQSKSAPLAAELVRLLDEAKLDSIAARHGTEADRFVGALYFPETQLLVVSARFPAPDRMTYLLREKSYRDVYIDLNSASDRSTKVFVSDLGANGLRFRRENDQPFDTVDLADRSVLFDGEWGRAKLSEAEYRKLYEEADERYAQMLQSLIAALKKTS